jgi:predicted esterase
VIAPLPRPRPRLPVLLLLPLPALLGALRAHGAWGVAYPPADTSEARPAIVFLHGMWSSPEDACATFEPAAAPFGFLACPRGNAPLSDGSNGRMWAGTYASVAPSVHAALDAAEALAPGKLDRTAGGTLMGYSNGAYFAAEIALHEPGRWTGLVLLSMHLELDASRLRAAGIHRVVLAAGDKDMATPNMKALAAALDAGGLPARFVSLGAGGHELLHDLDARMVEPVAWVRQ